MENFEIQNKCVLTFFSKLLSFEDISDLQIGFGFGAVFPVLEYFVNIFGSTGFRENYKTLFLEI